MRKTQLLHRLSDLLSHAELQLAYNSHLSLYDDNRIWEDTICKLLNQLCGWNLRNLNYEQKNYPGIDLADENEGIGVQVSVQKDSAKINYSIAEILKHNVHKDYPKFRFFVLGTKQKRYTLDQTVWDGLLEFDPQNNILDFSDVQQLAAALDTSALEQVVDWLEYELTERNLLSNEAMINREAVEAYAVHQMQENASISILGLGVKLPIKKIWMQLRLVVHEEIADRGQVWNFLSHYDEYAVKRDQKYDVETLLAESGNKVVLAGPGMGKSTLCKRLYMLAEERGHHVVKVRLWDVAGYMRKDIVFEEAVRLAMGQNLQVSFTKSDLSHFSVMILDGLDECGDFRRKIAKEIASWGRGHQQIMIIVTSRPVGYDDTELVEYKHYQILPLDEDDLDKEVGKLLSAMGQADSGALEWFQAQINSVRLKTLACRSPLLLGFLVQLAIQKKAFGKYRTDLYEDILQEWLRRSSRDNDKGCDESVLLYGIRIIAFYMMSHVNDSNQAYGRSQIVEYVGGHLAKELGCGTLQGRQNAEKCLNFWTERGILDQNYLQQEAYYLFLHLNIGEYLAASYLAECPEKMQRTWIRENYRDHSWHETIRLAIGCEKHSIMLRELVEIERQSSLPDGAVFLAAEGALENRLPDGMQPLYDQLLAYLTGNNPYLVEKAANAAAMLREKSLDWRVERFVHLLESPHLWQYSAGYHVYFAMPQEALEYERIRQFILQYVEKFSSHLYRGRESNLILAVQLLHRDAQDAEVVEALRKIYYEHCSMFEMEVLTQYFEEIGLIEWANAYLKGKMPDFRDIDYERVNQTIYGAEKRFVQILAEIYGMTVPEEKLEQCVEYSKIESAVGLMDSTIPDMKNLYYDLQNEEVTALIRAFCKCIDLDILRLQKELYILLHEESDSRVSISGSRRSNVGYKIDWEQTCGAVAIEELSVGLYSRSDMMENLAVEIALRNLHLPGMKDLILEMFQSDDEDLVWRGGILLLTLDRRDVCDLILDRINDENRTVVPCLYQFLGECLPTQNTDMWLSAVKRGLQQDRYTVSAVLKYLEEDVRQVSPEIVEQIHPLVMQEFHQWMKKEIRCTHCNGKYILDQSGFCPKCRIGGNLPLGDFVRVLAHWQLFTLDELAGYLQHPNSDVSKAAVDAVDVYLRENQQELNYGMEKIVSGAYPVKMFERILRLPAEQTAVVRDGIMRIAEGDHTGLVIRFIRELGNLEWLSDDERKVYLVRQLESASADIRSEAMRCWLGEKPKDWWFQ